MTEAWLYKARVQLLDAPDGGSINSARILLQQWGGEGADTVELGLLYERNLVNRSERLTVLRDNKAQATYFVTEKIFGQRSGGQLNLRPREEANFPAQLGFVVPPKFSEFSPRSPATGELLNGYDCKPEEIRLRLALGSGNNNLGCYTPKSTVIRHSDMGGAECTWNFGEVVKGMPRSIEFSSAGKCRATYTLVKTSVTKEELTRKTLIVAGEKSLVFKKNKGFGGPEDPRTTDIDAYYRNQAAMHQADAVSSATQANWVLPGLGFIIATVVAIIAWQVYQRSKRTEG